VQFTQLLVGAAISSTIWYFGVGLLHRIPGLEDSQVLTWVQYAGPALMLVGLTFGLIEEVRRALARSATARVAVALDRIKDENPDMNVAEISAHTVAASVKAAGVSQEHLIRLAEQRKQHVLIDEESFRTEVAGLIVDYLQPLPRSVKRLLNRFRVTLVIADRRGLFDTEPTVTRQQIGKWLVLGERWPQLRLSLSAVPEMMKVLERAAGTPAPPPVAAGQVPAADRFVESMKSLAPAYVGDEDLRRFIHSAPALAVVLPRLVNFGGESRAA
jgi:hypothetical protein